VGESEAEHATTPARKREILVEASHKPLANATPEKCAENIVGAATNYLT